MDSILYSEQIEYLLGSSRTLENLKEEAPMVPFSESTLVFLDRISVKLRENEEVRKNLPDLFSFAFWCRRAHLEEMKKKYLREGEYRLGKAVSLHFASSNIPVMFAFSLASGLLSGNCCIVKLPSVIKPQETAFLRVMRHVFGEPEGCDFAGRIVLCRYGHDRRINDALSSLCDVRVMWGSDASIAEIRRSPLPPRAVEIPFAGRKSAAVFSADEMLRTEDLDLLVKSFYNDTYLNDQNACSSPQIICWIGGTQTVRKAQEKFYSALDEYLKKKQYRIQASVAVNKLDAAFYAAAVLEGAEIVRCDNRIVRMLVDRGTEKLWDYTVPGGFFLEFSTEKISGLFPILTKQCQTLSVFGLDREELAGQLLEARVEGVDRIVPVGHTLDFSLTWDGMNLIEYMSRQVIHI